MKHSMQSATVRKLIGCFLVAFGALTEFGWLSQQSWALQLHPQMIAMVFNTAVCLQLTGVALMLFGTSANTWAIRTIAGVLIALPTALAIAHMFPLANSIDWPQLHNWLDDGNLTPGRMAPNTAAGFAFTGVALFTLTRKSQARGDTVLMLALFGQFLIAVTGFVGYWAAADQMIYWLHTPMALTTAIALLVVSYGIWISWKERDQHVPPKPEQRIVRASAAIVIAVAVTAGIAGFAMLHTQTESAIQNLLSQALYERVALLQRTRDQTTALSHSISLNLTENLPSTISPTEFELHLANAAQSSFASARMVGFRSVTVTRADGEIVFSRGEISIKPQLIASLDQESRTWMLWDQELLIRTRTEIKSASADWIGSLILERSLPWLTIQLNQPGNFGSTGEISMCTSASAKLIRCFPTQQTPEVFETDTLAINGRPLPITRALAGESAGVVAIDYHGRQVVAAFTALPGSKIGIVLKQAADEVYAPIRRQFLWTLPLLSLMVLLGLILMRWNVRPLAIAMASSANASREAYDQIAAIFDNVDNGLITTDADGRILTANPAADHIFLFMPGMSIGKNFLQLLPTRYRATQEDRMRQHLRKPFGTISRAHADLVGIRQDDTEFPLELSLNGVWQADGVRFIAVVRDVSLRKKAEAAVLFERERLRVTLQSIGDAVITLNTEKQVTYLNPVAEKLTGWRNQHADGVDISKVFRLKLTSSAVENHGISLDQVLGADLVITQALDGQLIRDDGELISISVRAAPIRDNEQATLGTVLVFRDDTKEHLMATQMAARNADLEYVNRKLAGSQTQLLQSEKMASIGQLAAGVAHEINNPIGYVNSNMGSLRNYLDDIFRVLDAYADCVSAPADVATLSRLEIVLGNAELAYLRRDIYELIAESQDGLVRVKNIVQDLKDFSHADSGEWQTVDLHRGLESTLNVAASELRYKADIIKCYGVLPLVRCLPFQINQVFMNLLVNAAHAIEKKGTISITTGCDGEHVWIRIADTGKGIEPEHVNRIFDPFFTTKPVGVGTGLGLSVTYGIVQRHHGSIQVISELGVGTTFTLRLPVTGASEPDPDTPPQRLPPSP